MEDLIKYPTSRTIDALDILMKILMTILFQKRVVAE
jgi:hypothetical protein